MVDEQKLRILTDSERDQILNYIKNTGMGLQEATDYVRNEYGDSISSATINSIFSRAQNLQKEEQTRNKILKVSTAVVGVGLVIATASLVTKCSEDSATNKNQTAGVRQGASSQEAEIEIQKQIDELKKANALLKSQTKNIPNATKEQSYDQNLKENLDEQVKSYMETKYNNELSRLDILKAELAYLKQENEELLVTSEINNRQNGEGYTYSIVAKPDIEYNAKSKTENNDAKFASVDYTR